MQTEWPLSSPPLYSPQGSPDGHARSPCASHAALRGRGVPAEGPRPQRRQPSESAWHFPEDTHARKTLVRQEPSGPQRSANRPQINPRPRCRGTQFRTGEVSSVPSRNVQIAPSITGPSRSELAQRGAPSTQLAEGGVNSYLGRVYLEERCSGPARFCGDAPHPEKLRQRRVRSWSV